MDSVTKCSLFFMLAVLNSVFLWEMCFAVTTSCKWFLYIRMLLFLKKWIWRIIYLSIFYGLTFKPKLEFMESSWTYAIYAILPMRMVLLIYCLIPQWLNHRSLEIPSFLELLIFQLNLKEYLAKIFAFGASCQEFNWSIDLQVVLGTQAWES